MRKYKHHTSHWKSVWQGPESSPVQWQHRRMIQNYSRSSTWVSHQPSLTSSLRESCMRLWMTMKVVVSIRGQLITNFSFADDIVVNAEEEEEAGDLIDRLDRTTTRFKMEIGPDKTKVMANNPNGFQREIKIKGQRLEEVENFKYLGAIISNEGSKPEILSRIAQTTAALSRLKIIWRDKNISFAFKVKLMRTLILSTFLYACESWTLTAEIKRRIQALEVTCYRRLLNISCKDHVTNKEVRNRIQNAIGVHDDLTMVKKWKLRWYGHISRSSGMAKTMLQGTVKGARRRGRQKKRWEDDIKEWMGMGFGDSLRAAEDREGWKGIVATSSVMPRRPPRLRDWDEMMRWVINLYVAIYEKDSLIVNIYACTSLLLFPTL